MIRLLLLVCLIPFTTGCWLANMARTPLVGSGNVLATMHDFSDFDSVHVGNAFRLQIIQGDEFAVEIQADDNVMPHIDVSQSENHLKIRLQSGSYSLQNVTLKALVTMPQVRHLDASGASRVAFESLVVSEPLTLDASGASRITGDIECPRIEIDVSGASRVELSGTVGAAELDVSGTSRATLSALTVGDATIEASGASKAHVLVAGRLDARASGASNISYDGDPELGRIKESGASSINKR